MKQQCNSNLDYIPQKTCSLILYNVPFLYLKFRNNILLQCGGGKNPILLCEAYMNEYIMVEQANHRGTASYPTLSESSEIIQCHNGCRRTTERYRTAKRKE